MGYLALKLAISLGSLYFIARSIIWDDVAKVFRRIQATWLFLALGIFWIAQVVSSLRCAYIARALGGHLDLSTSVRAHFVGLWFNQVLPTSLGGDVVKIAVLKERRGLNLAFRSAILDRFSGLMFLMLAIALTLPLCLDFFRSVPSFVVGLAMLSLAFMLATGVSSWGAVKLPERIRLIPVLREVIQLLADIESFSSRRRIWEQVWTSAFVHFNGIAAYALLGLAIGVHVDAVTFVLVVPGVFLVALLPISFAGWGIREASAVWLFGVVGMPKESALAISICYGLLLIIAGLPGLLLFMSGSKRGVASA